jgi:hypothetical protein
MTTSSLILDGGLAAAVAMLNGVLFFHFGRKHFGLITGVSALLMGCVTVVLPVLFIRDATVEATAGLSAVHFPNQSSVSSGLKTYATWGLAFSFASILIMAALLGVVGRLLKKGTILVPAFLGAVLVLRFSGSIQVALIGLGILVSATVLFFRVFLRKRWKSVGCGGVYAGLAGGWWICHSVISMVDALTQHSILVRMVAFQLAFNRTLALVNDARLGADKVWDPKLIPVDLVVVALVSVCVGIFIEEQWHKYVFNTNESLEVADVSRT